MKTANKFQKTFTKRNDDNYCLNNCKMLTVKNVFDEQLKKQSCCKFTNEDFHFLNCL